jgi:hypothetical protein
MSWLFALDRTAVTGTIPRDGADCSWKDFGQEDGTVASSQFDDRRVTEPF